MFCITVVVGFAVTIAVEVTVIVVDAVSNIFKLRIVSNRILLFFLVIVDSFLKTDSRTSL